MLSTQMLLAGGDLYLLADRPSVATHTHTYTLIERETLRMLKVTESQTDKIKEGT